MSSATSPIRCRACTRAAAHGSRAAARPIGWIGELHPQLVQEFDFTYAPILFEVEYLAGSGGKNAAF